MTIRILLVLTSALGALVTGYGLSISSDVPRTVVVAGEDYATSGRPETARWAYRYVLAKYPLSPSAARAASGLVALYEPARSVPTIEELSTTGLANAGREWASVIVTRRSAVVSRSAPYGTVLTLGLVAALWSVITALVPGTAHRGRWVLLFAATSAASALSFMITTGLWPGHRVVTSVARVYQGHTYWLVALYAMTVTVLCRRYWRQVVQSQPDRDVVDVVDEPGAALPESQPAAVSARSRTPGDAGEALDESQAEAAMPRWADRDRGVRKLLVIAGLLTGVFVVARYGGWTAAGAGRMWERLRGADPAEEVQEYWGYVSKKRYEDGWRMLSESFRERNFGNDRSRYELAFNDMQLCDVSVREFSLLKQGTGEALVEATVVFRSGAECAESAEKLTFTLVRQGSRWTIERVTRGSSIQESASPTHAGQSRAAESQERLEHERRLRDERGRAERERRLREERAKEEARQRESYDVCVTVYFKELKGGPQFTVALDGRQILDAATARNASGDKMGRRQHWTIYRGQLATGKHSLNCRFRVSGAGTSGWQTASDDFCVSEPIGIQILAYHKGIWGMDGASIEFHDYGAWCD